MLFEKRETNGNGVVFVFNWNRNQLTINKPIYFSFTILDWSKLHLYESFHDVLQPYFGENNQKLTYTDRISFFKLYT